MHRCVRVTGIDGTLPRPRGLATGGFLKPGEGPAEGRRKPAGKSGLVLVS